MYQKVKASYFISANIVGTDLAPADWGAKIAFSPLTNQSAIRKPPEARLIVGFQLRSAPVSPPGEPGFSGISATEAGRSGQCFRVFPAATSQKDLECGIFRICVRAELIESPINLAALTSGQRWHTSARNTHEWLLPFVSFRAKPNPALPAAGKKRKKRESPPSVQFQFTFQFQGALLARLCLSGAKAANKNTGAFEAKNKATVVLYYSKHNQNNNNKHRNRFNLPSSTCFFFLLYAPSLGGSEQEFILSSPLIVMGHGKGFTKLCQHMWKQRGGSDGRAIAANEFLRKCWSLLSDVTPANRNTSCLD